MEYPADEDQEERAQQFARAYEVAYRTLLVNPHRAERHEAALEAARRATAR